MQPSPSAASRVPPGFARPLTVGEIPLMAGSSHNKHPEAPRKSKATYTMLLPSSSSSSAAAGLRGYHGLRFLRLKRLYSRQLLQRYCLLLSVAAVGLLLLLWRQVTLPLLQQLQQLRHQGPLFTSPEDRARCEALQGAPRVYVQGALVSLASAGRRELLQDLWGAQRRRGAAAAAAAAAAPLTLQQHDGLMAFFESLAKALQLKRVQWALGGPTLVGSLSRHSLLREEKEINLLISEKDKKKVREACSIFDPSSELLRPQAYFPQALLAWLAATKAKPKFEEQAVNSPYGLITLDTSAAADHLSFPELRVRIYWFKEVREKPPGAAADWEPYAEITAAPAAAAAAAAGAAAARPTVPLQQLLPFVDRPLGLLSVPAPKNPLFYLNRFYNSSDPFCAALQQQQEEAAAAAGAAAAAPGAAGGAADSAASNSWGFLSYLRLPFNQCSSSSSSSSSGTSKPTVRLSPISENCLKESFYFGGELQLEVYTRCTYTPAPGFATWVPTIWRR
ncbi:hypothetical protein ETH_00019630 [Eimeria tenella]|uniref:Uncharacterized protein n=1 Tax=Eimeria tenella TaxID=5802 RepID=U6KYD0_EIMTE|nr:hypothetical protein ETH_00019630 [Eimeria tenella]CDJ40490.1 hypothetical protein ETH_00019630 [Eimeria tenella]|eukprot:XP_013231240.1 hypothetical protein ETH_00019630 [Eimeria tenella]